MRKCVSKIVALLLCIVLACGIMPASAATIDIQENGDTPAEAYEEKKDIQTNASSASTSCNYDGFPSADAFIAQACKLLGAPYNYGSKGYSKVYTKGAYSSKSLSKVRADGVDCSGLVYWTMTQMGYTSSGFDFNNPVPVDSINWVTGNSSCKLRYKGKTTNINVEKSKENVSQRPYWQMANGQTIAPGSVVIMKPTDGYKYNHVWIYLGEFESRQAVINYLKSIGVDSSLLTSKNVEDGSGNGGTHWRIESTSSDLDHDGECEISQVCINNRTAGGYTHEENFWAFQLTSHGPYSVKTTKAAVSATCKNVAYTKETTCSVCNRVIESQKVSSNKLFHNYVNGKCSYCGKEKSAFTTPLDAVLDDFAVVRAYGDTRYETSFATANLLKKAMNVSKFENIVVATGTNYADALSGSMLAIEKNAPILLLDCNSKENSDTVVKYIRNNLKTGGTVYLLGGSSVISSDFQKTISSAVGEKYCKRLSGATRYETNLAVLKECASSDQILVCSGGNYADAVAASATGIPILLVNGETGALTDEQSKYLSSNKFEKITIIGGQSAVSENLSKAVSKYGTVNRVSGALREDTAVAVANAYFTKPTGVVLAYSQDFPDALCAGPLANKLGLPILTAANTDTGKKAAKTYYTTLASGKKLLVIGGEGAAENPQLTDSLVKEMDSNDIHIYQY